MIYKIYSNDYKCYVRKYDIVTGFICSQNPAIKIHSLKLARRIIIMARYLKNNKISYNIRPI
jgi:hypothetical protein